MRMATAPRDNVLRVIHEAACAYGYPDLKPEQKEVLKSFVEATPIKTRFCECHYFVLIRAAIM